MESLNPNSLYHLALRVNYPNAFDREKAREEQRTGLGGDIMIHGNTCSVGCLAMGDKAIEEIFTLAAHIYPIEIPIILSPVDFRKKEIGTKISVGVEWQDALYFKIRRALVKYRH